jgi:HPt (histidine-containing phosphotransfer) domain-containing protein
MSQSRGDGRNLKIKLLIGCLTPLVVGALCQAMYTVSAQKRALIGGLEVKARSLGELMVDVVGPSVALDDRQGVRYGLGFLAHDADFAFAEALTPDGKVIAFLGSTEAQANLGDRVGVVKQPRLASAADVIAAMYPLKEMGTVVVGLKTTNIRASAQRLASRTALIAGVAILMAVVVVLLLAAAVVRRNRDLKLIMDTVGQGFMSVRRDGAMLPEHSAILELWFGPWRPGVPFWRYFGGVSGKLERAFELLWSNIESDALPLEVALDQLPRRAEIKGRTFELECKPVGQAESVSQFLLVISDITAVVEQERTEIEQRECMSLFQWLLHDSATLFQFIDDGTRLVQALVSSPGAQVTTAADLVVLKRDIHTLKGNASIFYLTSVTALCEVLEERLEDSGEGLTEDERLRISAVWKGVERRMRQLGEKNQDRIEIAVAEYQSMIAAIDRRAPYPSLDDLVRGWVHEPMKQRLHRYGELARALARKLDRGELSVQIQAEPIRLPKGALAPFWSSVIHVIRNAVDHGLESADERMRRGKTGPGTLRLRATQRTDRLVIEIEDDGRGICWDRLAESARAVGLPYGTREDLVEAIFADGLTTRLMATDISGRGVGMAVVRAACVDTGGAYLVWSEPGQGTRFEFSWPLSVLRTERATEASTTDPEVESTSDAAAAPAESIVAVDAPAARPTTTTQPS